jgi:transcriptional regulator with XRE-family HTH domain
MGVHVPDPEGLEAAVAMTRIIRASKLSGTEFRSLRRACDLRAIELAEYLEVRPETISRWENDKEAIGPQFDKMMRFVVGSILADRAPGVPFDKQVITRMQIRHLTVSGVNKKEPFFFQRIKVRVNHRHETEWEPFDKAA